MSRAGRAAPPGGLALIMVIALISGPWGTGTDRMRSVSPVPGVPGDPARGERLFERLDCIRCHSEPRAERGINMPPPLSAAGSRAKPEWMVEYLLDPHPMRYQAEGILPDLCMPRAGMSRRDAVDLTAFLAGQIDSTLAPAWTPPTDEAAMTSLAKEGETLFRRYQCLGCHELGGEGRRIGPSLDGVGERRRPDYVRALLLDPQHVIPGTSMKDLDLWDEEADALVAFLLTLRTRSERK